MSEIIHKKELLKSWINDLDYEQAIDELVSEYINGEDTLQFKLNWTQLAGQVSERKNIVAYIRKRSGELFASGNDEIARSFRMLANQLESDGKKDLLELDKLIKQSEKIDQEIK